MSRFWETAESVVESWGSRRIMQGSWCLPFSAYLPIFDAGKSRYTQTTGPRGPGTLWYLWPRDVYAPPTRRMRVEAGFLVDKGRLWPWVLHCPHLGPGFVGIFLPSTKRSGGSVVLRAINESPKITKILARPPAALQVDACKYAATVTFSRPNSTTE